MGWTTWVACLRSNWVSQRLLHYWPTFHIVNFDKIEHNKKEAILLLFCGLQKGVWYYVAWSVMASVGWPRGGGMLLVMPVGNVCQGYRTRQPPKRGCHLQLQVLARCETRLPSQPPIVWAIFGCAVGALGRHRMRCTGPSRRARMATVFCKWPHFDVKIRSGTVTTVRCTPTVLSWTWNYREREKNKSHDVQLC